MNIFPIFLLLSCATFTWAGKKKENRMSVGASVKKLGLITEEVTAASILENHQHYHKKTKKRRFKGKTLVYVTPWNKKGFTLSTRFVGKLDYISPVWFRISFQQESASKPSLKLKVEGQGDVDYRWIKAVRTKAEKIGHSVRLVPRFHVQGPPTVYQQLAGNEKFRKQVIKKFIQLVEKYEMDGLTLEMTEAWHYATTGQQRTGLNTFVAELGSALHSHIKSYHFVLVVRPWFPNTSFFHGEDFSPISQDIDLISMMSYDYTQGKGKAGPNSPLSWCGQLTDRFLGNSVQDSEIASRYAMGVPFYGYDHSEGRADAVLSHDIVKLLETHSPAVEWDAGAAEHFIQYDDEYQVKHTVYFPTLKFLDLRLRQAESSQVGIAIWDLGQGFDYFLDLL